ncbi:uncharacterized protein TNCV_2987151 [Trichonephila clavipes]|nr:uncharacterized protein TNCV_2987151 [Trichonephila clavipes]
MGLGKQCQIQSAVSKSLAMMVDVQEVGEDALKTLQGIVRPSLEKHDIIYRMTTNSPPLNPVDYSVWSILESRACTKSHKTLDSVKQSLLREWGILKVKDLRFVVENFCKRLSICIAEIDIHFETN